MGYPCSSLIAAVADATTSTSATATAGTTRPASGPSADRRVVEYPDVDKREKSNAHQSLLQWQMARWPGFGMPSPPEAEQEAHECAPRGGRAGRAGRHQSSKDRRQRHRLVRLELSRNGTVRGLRVSFEGVVAAATPSGRPRARPRRWHIHAVEVGLRPKTPSPSPKGRENRFSLRLCGVRDQPASGLLGLEGRRRPPPRKCTP